MQARSLVSFMAFISLLSFIGCGSILSAPSLGSDDTDKIQRLVDRNVTIPAGHYLIRRSIVVRKSNAVVQGVGPNTVFTFEPAMPLRECWNDRAFTTSCDSFFNQDSQTYVSRRRIVAPISIGDRSFKTDGDASDLHPGDWIVLTERDAVIRDVVTIDWILVASASGNTVDVQTPFRTAFPNSHKWDPIYSGLGYFKVINPVQNTQFRDFTLQVPDSGQNIPGISVFNAQHVLVENVDVQDDNGQALYSYMSKDVTFRHCVAESGPVLSEFAATTDLTVTRNSFTSNGDAGFGLDLGTGFFDVDNNTVGKSWNTGLYLLYGVHDGSVQGNLISYVPAPANAIGILARGTQNVIITNNELAGGQGQQSIGLSIGPEFGSEVPIESAGNVVSPNAFGAWAMDYDPTNVP